MPKRKLLSRPLLEQALPWLVLALLITYTYAFFFQAPYPGFDFTPSSGRVQKVFATSVSDTGLQVGDHFIQIGPLSWTDFRANFRQSLFDGVQPGQVIPIVIERNNQLLTIPWIFLGPTPAQVLYRLNSEWFIAYIFWLAGIMTVLFLRPKDARWRLLIAFNFLTALWLEAGTVSRWHVWESGAMLRAAVWLSLPVYWHLHWLFPQPLRHLPTRIWWFAYLIGSGLAISDWFHLLPKNLYLYAIFLALVGSIVLLATHFILQPTQRRNVGLLALAVILVLTPSIAISIAGTFRVLPANAALALLTFPILPFAYLYATYRRQLGGLELRANRLIASYIFLTLLGAVMVIIVAVADSWLNFPGKATSIGILATLFAASLTAVTLLPFQRFVEKHVLGIPLPPLRLLETYTARITVSLDTPTLIHLLNDELLPSLLIRQSALLRLEKDNLTTFYTNHVAIGQLPTVDELPDLITQAGKYRASTGEISQLCTWARLILPLDIEKKTVGLWLLGRRDPDDFYTQAEISTLQTLAHQTAIALTNIAYAERLHALYQTSIDQREAERTSLGHELHDHILQQLFVLQQSAATCLDLPPFVKAYETVTSSLRHLIRGLRPPMLEYGLYRALVALADDWAQRTDPKSGLQISLEMNKTDTRYVPHVELHLYRIMQQAGENALRHARARTIKISGQLETNLVDLTLADDGIGFEAKRLLDLARPEARSHFGLIGMQERAALINAQIKFDSVLGQGTRINVKWCPDS